MTERESGNNHEYKLDGDGFPSPWTTPWPEQDDSSNGTTPLADVSLIQADDALLNALGGPDPHVAESLGEPELNQLLLAWRRDIDSEPIAELVDTQEAVTTIQTAALAKRNNGRAYRRRMMVPVAVAAAVVAIGFTGTAVAARDAQPGDALWGLSKVLYSEHAQSVEAAASVRTDLQEAQLALAQRRYDDARQSLHEAGKVLPKVAVEDDAAELKAQHTELVERLNQPADNSGQLSPPQMPPAISSSQTSNPEPSGSSPQPSDPTTSPSTEPSNQSPPPPSQSSAPSSTPPSTPTGDTTSGDSDGSGSGPRVGSVSGDGTEATTEEQPAG